ncbi:MAG: GFA family protein [Proteobacteria bacterium]|nr:GFA family protein [Pseudomonadota bacterium]MDA0927806.1 GFA family protein [Pseudomonadota bacterium]
MFKGSCHCGAVKFEIHNQTELQDLMRCNCSLCQKKGIVMATAKLDDLVITEGADKLTLYQWNTKIAKHYFCSVCGIYTHHQRRRRPDEYGVNVACIEGVDVSSLTNIRHTDGRDLSLVDEA